MGVDLTGSWVNTISKVHWPGNSKKDTEICTIFEGTSEIQRLNISRVISEVHVRQGVRERGVSIAGKGRR